MVGPRKIPANYFILGHPGLTFFISVGLVLMATTWLCPEVYSSSSLGLLGQLLFWLGTQHNTFVMLTFVPVMIIHVVEAVTAVYLCLQLRLTTATTILWTIQVLLIGILSLRFLIWPLRDAEETAEREKYK